MTQLDLSTFRFPEKAKAHNIAALKEHGLSILAYLPSLKEQHDVIEQISIYGNAACVSALAKHINKLLPVTKPKLGSDENVASLIEILAIESSPVVIETLAEHEKAIRALFNNNAFAYPPDERSSLPYYNENDALRALSIMAKLEDGSDMALISAQRVKKIEAISQFGPQLLSSMFPGPESYINSLSLTLISKLIGSAPDKYYGDEQIKGLAESAPVITNNIRRKNGEKPAELVLAAAENHIKTTLVTQIIKAAPHLDEAKRINLFAKPISELESMVEILPARKSPDTSLTDTEIAVNTKLKPRHVS